MNENSYIGSKCPTKNTSVEKSSCMQSPKYSDVFLLDTVVVFFIYNPSIAIKNCAWHIVIIRERRKIWYLNATQGKNTHFQ